ncbi:MAG: hypothetical protein R3B06_20205 [Kofleriaceae bacterium]
MTSISRPGGPPGPTGPTGPDGADALDRADAAADGGAVAGAGAAGTTTGGDAIAQLARAVDSGAVAPEAAIDQLIDQAVAGLPADQAAEVRAAMTDALAHDPYLAGLARELGVAGSADDPAGDPAGGPGA